MTRLLVKMPNWVGDCLMATPALALMKAAIPGVRIDALCRPSVAGVLADNPHITDLIQANDKALEPETVKRIHSNNYDAAVLMTNSLGSAWLVKQLKIPKRIGFNREHRGLLLTSKIPFKPLEWQTPTPKPLSRRSIKGTPQPGLPRPMVEYYLEIARATITAVAPQVQSLPSLDYKMVLPLHRSSEERVARLLRENNIVSKLLIGINPGAAHGPAKRWPPERLGHLVESLARPDWVFVSTAAPGEKELNDQVQEATTIPIVRLGEQVSLRELPALISKFAVYITNDSGPMHIAAARGVPTIAIFGPTDPGSTRPWEAQHTLVRHPVPCSPCFLEECPINHPCMLGIDSFDVATATMESLSNNAKWTPFLKS